MKEMGFRVTSFACNQLLILYKRSNKKKIADVLLLMEKENVIPSIFTYKILIDTKGQSNDLTGMEGVVEMMKAQGMKPNIDIKATLARHSAEVVERVWKVSEENPKIDECLAAIVACGKLRKITEAEASLDRMKQWKRLLRKHYGTILEVCADTSCI